MRRRTVWVLAALLLGVGIFGAVVAQVGVADSASKLGDLSAVAAALGVEPEADGTYTAARVFEALADRLTAVEQSRATTEEIAKLARRTGELERNLAMEYASRLYTLERELGDLVNRIEHLGGSPSLEQFARQVQQDIRTLQCAMSPCVP